MHLVPMLIYQYENLVIRHPQGVDHELEHASMNGGRFTLNKFIR